LIGGIFLAAPSTLNEKKLPVPTDYSPSPRRRIQKKKTFYQPCHGRNGTTAADSFPAGAIQAVTLL
jgi:hypothetical protein